MRKSRAEAARTRGAIVEAAAGLIRRQGLGAASLESAMAAAGLSHGGFYRHFGSRDQLLGEALAAAGQEAIAAIARKMDEGGLDAVIDHYLSASHRDATTPLCPLAALGSELARAGGPTRGEAARVVAGVVDALLADAQDDEQRRRDVLVILSTMVGALTLARVASTRRQSDEILRCVRQHLHGTAPVRRRKTRPRPEALKRSRRA